MPVQDSDAELTYPQLSEAGQDLRVEPAPVGLHRDRRQLRQPVVPSLRQIGDPAGRGYVAPSADLRAVAQGELQRLFGGGLGSAPPLDGPDPSVVVPGERASPVTRLGAIATD